MKVFQGDVLGSWSEMVFSSHSNTRLIVFPNFAMKVRLVDVERNNIVDLFHHGHQRKNLSSCQRESHELSFSCAKSEFSIHKLRFPINRTACILDNVTSS